MAYASVPKTGQVDESQVAQAFSLCEVKQS
jgi:hypothetical protein